MKSVAKNLIEPLRYRLMQDVYENEVMNTNLGLAVSVMRLPCAWDIMEKSEAL